MSPIEFDILDELYFVTSFRNIVAAVQFPETAIKQTLFTLVQKGYIKCLFPDPDTEIIMDHSDFNELVDSSFFLATKAGLLAHNSN